MSTATLTSLRDFLYGTLSPANLIWLGKQLTDYGHQQEQLSLKPYSMKEINAMLDKAESDFEAGLGILGEDVHRELEEEFATEDAQEDAL